MRSICLNGMNKEYIIVLNPKGCNYCSNKY